MWSTIQPLFKMHNIQWMAPSFIKFQCLKLWFLNVFLIWSQKLSFRLKLDEWNLSQNRFYNFKDRFKPSHRPILKPVPKLSPLIQCFYKYCFLVTLHLCDVSKSLCMFSNSLIYWSAKTNSLEYTCFWPVYVIIRGP